MEGMAKTPPAKHLFSVSEITNKLSEERAQILHHQMTNYFTYARRCYKTYKLQ